jgi:phage replication initiation protein
VIRQVLKMNLSDFILEDYTRYHYPQYFRYGAMNLYVDTQNEKQGVLLELSGSGCRELELVLEEQGRDWYDLLRDCIQYDEMLKERFDSGDSEAYEKSYFNVTRLDIALDEFYSEEGNYNLFDLFRHFQAGHVVSKKQSYSSRMGGEMGQAGVKKEGLTLYIGKPQSTPFFRFYEKDAERSAALGLSMDSIHELYGFKNRYEIILRGDKSNDFVRHFVSEQFEIAQKAVEIINDNLTVFSDFHGHLDEAWYDLMHSFKAYRFESHPKMFDMTRVWAWAETSVFPTMASLKKDDEVLFYQFLEEAKLPKRHEHYHELKERGRVKDESSGEPTDSKQQTDKFFHD